MNYIYKTKKAKLEKKHEYNDPNLRINFAARKVVSKIIY